MDLHNKVPNPIAKGVQGFAPSGQDSASTGFVVGYGTVILLKAEGAVTAYDGEGDAVWTHTFPANFPFVVGEAVRTMDIGADFLFAGRVS